MNALGVYYIQPKESVLLPPGSKTQRAYYIYIHRRGAFGVARFDRLGNARALMRGTSDRYSSHAFFVNLSGRGTRRGKGEFLEYMENETLYDIGQSIEQHCQGERQMNASIGAIGRVFASIEATHPQRTIPNGFVRFWLTNQESYKSSFTYKEDGSYSVYKNTKLGEILTKYYQGIHSYQLLTNTKKVNNVEVSIYNRATFFPRKDYIAEVVIQLSGDKHIYRYQRLSDLLEEHKALEEKQKALKVLKSNEKEYKRQDEQQKKSEEELRIKEEIAQLEDEIAKSKAKISRVRSFIRSTLALRKQPLLDKPQEEAKRSHLYDGISIVIEGGPGTGKTTTVIQRLKFLTTQKVLEEYKAPISEEQKILVSDVNHKSWMFVSPTKLLLQYLRDNMQYEGLATTEENTIVIDDFRTKMIREYHLCKPDTDGPFKLYRIDGKYFSLILKPRDVVNEFEKYVVRQIAQSLSEISKLETKSYSWHEKAVRIKSYCAKSANIKDLNTLLDLFYSLQENEGSYVNELVNISRQKVKEASAFILGKIKSQPEIVDKLKILFDKWRKNRITEDEDLEEDDDELLKKIDFNTELYTKLKPLVRNYALIQIDANTRLSKRQNELYALVEPFMREVPGWLILGGLVWFVRKFANLCRGIERNVLDKIPQLYKGFRKEREADKNEALLLYNKVLLKKIIQKENNKHLHPDEQNFLLGFINNLLLGIYRKSKSRFNALDHSYVIAYKNYARPVLVIDEATDYTQLDYYMLYSFRHYDISSVTLSGDMMQGLNENGIVSWDDLNWIIPNLEKCELQTSYRQIPTLLRIAKEMYKDDLGYYPRYKSFMEQSNDEPAPLAFVSEDEDKKVQWISDRIREVYETYQSMPSVALFVGDNEDISKLVGRFVELDILNGIQIEDCSGNRRLEEKDKVRIFRLSEVKGLEFEVAFFHNIDNAIEDRDSEKLMRRYLYVGISRATTHLAATFSRQEGNENILKYFSQEDDWSI